MSWRDDLGTVKIDGKKLVGASFRKATFFVEESELSGGRRGPDHESPGLDGSYSEDLGRKGRKFSITGYVTGANYRSQKSALLKALEEAGPGDFADAYNGATKCVCREYSVRETSEEGRIARFVMSFVEQGDPPLNVSKDARGNLLGAVKKAKGLAQSDFVRAASKTLSGRPGWSLDSVTDALNSATRSIQDARRTIVSGPAAFQAQVQALINAAATLVLSPLDFWNSRESLLTLPVIPSRLLALFRKKTTIHGLVEPTFPTETRRREAAHLNATNAAQDRAIVLSKAGALTELELTDEGQADTVRRTLVTELDALIAADPEVLTDDMRQALEDVRAAVVAVLNEATELVGQSAITLDYTKPALVLASDLYGDHTRDIEIVQRNSNISHPFFLPVEKPLKVLDE
jgi:prophage DNA circulation protein